MLQFADSHQNEHGIFHQTIFDSESHQFNFEPNYSNLNQPNPAKAYSVGSVPSKWSNDDSTRFSSHSTELVAQKKFEESQIETNQKTNCESLMQLNRDYAELAPNYMKCSNSNNWPQALNRCSSELAEVLTEAATNSGSELFPTMNINLQMNVGFSAGSSNLMAINPNLNNNNNIGQNNSLNPMQISQADSSQYSFSSANSYVPLHKHRQMTATWSSSIDSSFDDVRKTQDIQNSTVCVVAKAAFTAYWSKAETTVEENNNHWRNTLEQFGSNECDRPSNGSYESTILPISENSNYPLPWQPQGEPNESELLSSSEEEEVQFDFQKNANLSIMPNQEDSTSTEGSEIEEVGKLNVCFICGKAYARPSTLKTHLRTHSGERPYGCSTCHKNFSQAANLTAHLRTHSGEKPFRCTICERRFSQSSSVTTHMRTHSGERPYGCLICRKSFSDSSTLTKHMRVHSGEKPYHCNLCFAKFSQSGNLNRHLRVHMANGTYVNVSNAPR